MGTPNPAECLVANFRGVVPASYISLQAAVVISIMTLWRVFFSKTIGKLCGGYSARAQCGTPIKPSIVSKYEGNPQSKWKLDSLRYFYLQNTALKKSLKAKPNSKQKYKLGWDPAWDEKLDFLKNSLNCRKPEIVEYFRYIELVEKYNEHSSKLSEELWKWITMTFITIFGCMVIYHADYFYDTTLYYVAYPQAYTPAMVTYYKLSLGYHGHRALWQVFDTKRKDFWAMCLHHWVTILLIVGSWHLGCMRFGCVVMFCHDNSDAIIAFGKLCLYNKWKTLSKIVFALFVLSWMVFRISLFWWKVLYSLMYQAVGLYDCHWLYTAFVVGLSILLLLHFYWLRLILIIAINSICKRRDVADVRSGSEIDDDEQHVDQREAQQPE